MATCGGQGNDCGSDESMPKKKEVMATKGPSICNICKERPASVQSRKDNSSLCKECFLPSMTARFKTNIARHAIVPKGDHVLVALSGGPSSRAMLHLLHASISEMAKKRMIFTVSVAYVDQGAALGFSEEQRAAFTEQVSALVSPYGYQLHVLRLEDALCGESELELEGESSLAPIERLTSLVAKTKTLSAREDVVANLTLQRLAQFAKERGFQRVLKGDNAMNMAMRILSDTSKGRGFCLPAQLSYTDSHITGVTFLNPMKDFLAKEVALYNHYLRLESVSIPTVTTFGQQGCSINHLTESFVQMLQADYPATVHTILRTAEKLFTPDLKAPSLCCSFCQSPLSHAEMAKSRRAEDPFPLLCYACTATKKEMSLEEEEDLPVFTSRQPMTRDELRTMISDVLIGPEEDETDEKKPQPADASS